MKHELEYYSALKRISRYDSPGRLRRDAQRLYGMDYGEVLEMAYENVLDEARSVIRGKRAPKQRSDTPTPQVQEEKE